MLLVSPAEFYGARICAVYERHNPTKLADVPSLLEKYAGCEAEMYDRICEKYGVEPGPAPVNLAPAALPRSPEPRSPEPRAVGFARKASAPPPPRPSGTSAHTTPAPEPARPVARPPPSA